ncbi:hypothetical protein PAMC26577_09015 [Caballeronia sordidicola]|uniref:Uncharacterized protein n=1 Tax=Caballeronia sordidicola TaxID=196367 RepID=A0A242N0B7_CABSO|nr:hypothetical protein PAMC26577_09015 [Caballeronia sordidicola]
MGSCRFFRPSIQLPDSMHRGNAVARQIMHCALHSVFVPAEPT